MSLRSKICMPLLALVPVVFFVVGTVGCADLENPPITQSIRWDSHETEALAQRACMPCHSHETEWAWYANVPGVDVALAADVAEARSHMNLSTWDQDNDDAWDAPEKVLDGEMPPLIFVLAHPEAKLSDEERRQLADGLHATFAQDPPLGGDADDADDADDD
jgi:hypothetical protein